MEGLSKIAIASMTGAALLVVVVLYDATVMSALGMMGDDRPLVQLEKGRVLYESFTEKSISGIDAMKKEYPSWFFDGSATVRGGSYDISQVREKGLYVGVSDPNPGDSVWSGIFAMSPNDYSSLYHVSITVPSAAVIDPADYANLGMYVQTDVTTGRINYVGCTIDIRPDKLILRVESGLGNDALVTSRTVHWEKAVSLDQKTMDCTLVTNGNNYFSATINGERVFVSDKLDLQMPRPFNSYLETQVKGIPDLVYGKFSDYYSAFSGELRVIKLSPGQKVSLGGVTAEADNAGIARLDISALRLPYSGSLIVDGEHADSVLARDDFMGGDLYSYGPINWIEQSKYKNVADRGGTIVGE
ncbi:MAG: hypothetical protein ABI347_06955 [Nitrososphaera sp.]|jgi:hypothetical protein